MSGTCARAFRNASGRLPVHPPGVAPPVAERHTSGMAGDDEQIMREEARENLRGAEQRIGAICDRTRATGTRKDAYCHGLVRRVAPELETRRTWRFGG